MANQQYDVAVIGGGPAGLQATLMLARTRKKIIVFDDPQPPRNGASHGVHNFLGVDGLRPAQIREIAWQQIDVYQSAELREERVVNIEKGADNCFQIIGDSGTSIRARQVILAFGYRDVHPDIAGFAECWADTIISCPFCDGYENRDRTWGIVARSAMEAIHFPMMLPNWTSDIKLLLQSGVTLEPDYEQTLINAGIAIHRGDITQIHHTGSKLEAVTLENGERVEVGTLLWIPPKQPLPLIQTLVDQLGLELDADGFVKTNEMQQTNIDRLWAAGDVQNARSGALHAAWTSNIVASMMIKGWYEPSSAR